MRHSTYQPRFPGAWIRPNLFKKKLEGKGWGIFTRTPITEGEIIGIEGEGAILTEAQTRQLRISWGDHSHQIAENFHWGPSQKGDLDMLDLMNHSCEPNAGLSGDMTFVALRRIQAGEELTWDYATSESDPKYQFTCRCGRSRCRKKVTGNDWMRLDLQRRYYRHFSPYLSRRIEQKLNTSNLRIVDGKLFFCDRTDPNQLSLHEIKKIIADEQSSYQHIQILETKSFGRALVLDGGAQISEKDAYIYTESLVWPALLPHANPRRILILGGGDGDTLSEVLRDTRVQQVVMVDIDPVVVSLSQRHLPMLWNGAHRDPRAHIITSLPGGTPADACLFLEQNKEQFDIIISDLTDPYESSTSAPLMRPAYFRSIRSCLTPKGIFVIQAGELTHLVWHGHQMIRRLTERFFSQLISYRVFVPWFDSQWSFILASNSPNAITEVKTGSVVGSLLAKHAPRIGGLSYLTPASFIGLFGIDPSLEEKISPTRKK